MYKQSRLFLWTLAGVAVFWLQAVFQLQDFPVVAGFWVAAGIALLVTGVIMGIIGWARFWMTIAQRWHLSIGAIFASFVLIRFGPELLQGDFFRGFWFVTVCALAAMAVMSAMALGALLLDKISARTRSGGVDSDSEEVS